MYDLIIIGSGPAGITAGIYAARKRIKTLVITKDFIGQTGKASTIENWPGSKKITGPELMIQFKEHLEQYEIEIIEGKSIIKVEKNNKIFDVHTTKGEKYSSKSVIIAVGRNPRPLEVPGGKEYLGKGISYCATCDGPFFTGKNVAIVGGGNSGYETAIEMAKSFSPKVYLLTLKSIADKILQEEAEKLDNLEIIRNVTIREVKGDNFVKSIVYGDINTEEKKEIEVEGLFVEMGYIPVADFAKEVVDYNEKDEIIINPKTCETKTKGIFAAGDVSDIRDKQIITSAAEGAKAALSVNKFLEENE